MKRLVWLVLFELVAFSSAPLTFAAGNTDEAGDGIGGAVVLGEEDFAERLEILRNQYRRMTPGDGELVQEVGAWPAAWEEFSPRWDTALATRDLATWVVPIVADREGGATVLRDGNGAELWRGTTDFTKEESTNVVLTGALVPEEEWALWKAAKDEIATRLEAASPTEGRGGGFTNGLRFTNAWADTNGDFCFDFAWETNGEVQVFCRAMHYEATTNTVVWTNDENEVVTNDVVDWHQVEGERFNGTPDTWELLGMATVTNGSGSFADSGFSEEYGRVRFYAVAALADTDGDGLTDGEEWLVNHTDPDNPDSDGDGVGDGAEAAMGFNPADAGDCPKVTIHAALYNPSGPDGGKEWVEVYSASTKPVDLGGVQLEIGRSAGWVCATGFPAGTMLAPGRCLLIGGSAVTNADIAVDQLDIPEPWGSDSDTGLRLVWGGATNGSVVDVVFIDGGGEFNDLDLDETGWLSTNGLRATAGEVLERRYPGVDTDRASDWIDVDGRPPRNSSIALDYDVDGLSDGQEWTGSANPWGEPTNPWNADSDGDGLSDSAECLTHGTNPNTWATDGDIWPWMPEGTTVSNWPGSDSYELLNGWNPLDADENTNGFPDSWEMAMGVSNLDGVADSDGDGVDNLSEILQNSDPQNTADSEEKPFVLMFEASLPGWENGTGNNDVGLGGIVNTRFLGIAEGAGISVWVEEGNVPEEFTLTWIGAVGGTTAVNGNFGIARADSADGAVLRFKDSGMHPEYVNTLGGEPTISAFSMQITNIKFNHDPTSSDGDALNVRQNQGTPFNLAGGEWTANGVNLPIVYHANRTVTVKARFTVVPASITSAEIWADAANAVGSLGNVQRTTLQFSGGVSVGDADGYVELSVTGNTPEAFQRTLSDMWNWHAANINGTSMSIPLGLTGPHAVYTVFSDPQSPWNNAPGNIYNLWTEALEQYFLYYPSALDSKTAALANIARYLQGDHCVFYDTENGHPFYSSSNANTISMRFAEYLAKSGGLYVNCRDQAAALGLFGRMIGIEAEYCTMAPFGYINATSLVGISGLCNNPFYPISTGDKLEDNDATAPVRLPFQYHAFVLFGGKVFDACVGPHVGTETLGQYISEVIDVSTVNELNEAGNASNAETKGLAFNP